MSFVGSSRKGPTDTCKVITLRIPETSLTGDREDPSHQFRINSYDVSYLGEVVRVEGFGSQRKRSLTIFSGVIDGRWQLTLKTIGCIDTSGEGPRVRSCHLELRTRLGGYSNVRGTSSKRKVGRGTLWESWGKVCTRRVRTVKRTLRRLHVWVETGRGRPYMTLHREWYPDLRYSPHLHPGHQWILSVDTDEFTELDP